MPTRCVRCGATRAPVFDHEISSSGRRRPPGAIRRRGALGILALSPFTHFPEVEGALATLGFDELIDGAGSTIASP